MRLEEGEHDMRPTPSRVVEEWNYSNLACVERRTVRYGETHDPAHRLGQTVYTGPSAWRSPRATISGVLPWE